MTIFDTLARGLMKSALDNVPPTRQRWGEAMHAEFEALDGDRFSWALGCWTSVARWNVGRDALVLAGAIGLMVLWDLVSPRILFEMPTEVLRAGAYLLTFGPHARFAGIMSICFPRHAGKFAVIATVVPSIYMSVTIWMMFGDNLLTSDWELMDAPKLVGYMAWFGACYLMADLGRRLAALRTKSASARG